MHVHASAVQAAPAPLARHSSGAFVPFELEEWQSRYEHAVKYNLADSGVHPVSLHELLSPDGALPSC